MKDTSIVFLAYLWNITLLFSSGYVVFYLNRNPLWIILAIVLMQKVNVTNQEEKNNESNF